MSPYEHIPEWARRARQLEHEDQLEEAERLIRESVPSLHCAMAIAVMYRERWIRMKERGDLTAAGKARNRAADWARTYASWATSGGEGAALSLERDEFLRSLGPEALDE